ncbi:tetratricopeptide repeat protein [Methylophilus aquaticus]|uniref:Tetratricopeptide repeat protein n=1 Tax=Methylophilus aquaticus TaxID=1971610 RepID=A0ABT9JP72_9PROT|nr:tetratricopeptide repeat protein [Methylophilus aquaticus]MDP8566378.1 tetratricopeptide repeat protein [Methylophilus aquaticus]
MEAMTSLVDQAWTALQHNRLDEAKTHATQAFTQAPDSADAAHVLGVIANRDGRADLALPLLQKAIAVGVTERRLRDMGEALLLAKHPQAALAPVQDAIRQFGENSDSLGLLAAIYAALENFDAASEEASRALALNPESLTWQTTISFAELIQCRFKQGLPGFSFRNQTLQEHARCPVFQFAQPGELWLRNEQGPGDTLFFLCVAPVLRARGWRLHVQTHAKMQKVLEQTGLFESVELAFTCPPHGFWINIGDLPLAAMQIGITVPQPPLPLAADDKLVAKLRKILEKFGPPPYVAVTWRGGVQGKKLRNGVRMGDREIDPTKLGLMLAKTAATIISVQRVPEQKEAAAFERALGRKYLNLSRLNDNLPEMLALMAIVDEYIAVPNTNHHLREALGRPSKILVNRPYEDWRWVVSGNSPWYPQAACYRQAIDGDISNALQAIAEDLNTTLAALPARSAAGQPPQTIQQPLAPAVDSEEDEHLATIQTLLAEGWAAVRENQFTNAIQLAQKVLALQAEHAGAFHLLGWTAMRDMKFELAVSLLQKALTLSPYDGRIVGDLMRALAVNGQNDLACQIAAGALQEPKMRVLSAIHYARAASYLHQNRIAEAIEDYQQCMKINPNRLDAPEFSGMSRLKLGDARRGFREFSARSVAQRPELLNDWCCPVLTPAHKGTRILIKRDMGLGDELSYLRYMPWLAQAGMVVDYWCGKKLKPILERTGLFHRVIADSVPPPAAEDYDLTFIVNEVPLASEQLGAPEIAPALPLSPDPALVSKWRAWLAEQGPGPYIGLNWRAGLGVHGNVNIFAKLAKSIDADLLSQALNGINATFISLQRNVMADDVKAFEQALGARLHDAASLTDDLDDLLALLSLLDENIGVSNTNMHLRAGLDMGSRVFVQFADGDWRWGLEGDSSPWFAQSQVYRQTPERAWQPPLDDLRLSLLDRYGLAQPVTPSATCEQSVQPAALTGKVIWVTAGEIDSKVTPPVSALESTNQRVIAPAMGLQSKGWQSVFVNEMMAEVMGGWCGPAPVAGDVVVFSKVMTAHALNMLSDARQRGAYVVVDVFNDFSQQPKRAAFQLQLIAGSHAMVSIADLHTHWQAQGVHVHATIAPCTDALAEAARTQIYAQWHQLLKALPNIVSTFGSLPASQALAPAALALDTQAFSAAPPTQRTQILPATSAARQIVWVTAGTLDTSLGFATSGMASTRYRVLLPAANLGPLGWQSRVVNEADLAQHGWGEVQFAAGDVLVVSKSLQPAILTYLQQVQQQGVHVIVDYCDNHFERPDAIGQHQHALLSLADRVIASTPELKATIEKLTQKPVDWITDCFEGQKKAPLFAPGDTLHMLWFGSHTNYDTLQPIFPALRAIAQTRPVVLEMVTLHPQGEQAARALSGNGLQVNYTPWSTQVMQSAFERCDIVLIPTLQSEQKAGKSPNRLVEALWAGRYVMTGDLPAYQPFSDFAQVGGDVYTHIQWALANPQAVTEKIARGQAYIIAHHTPKRIGQLWHEALIATQMAHQPAVQVSDAKTPTVVAHVTLPRKLNLGCGDKHLAGYINVDLVINEGAKKPDVICDIKALTVFESNSVDEILSVHVVEHFWRWEVLDVLKEWVRVLKPGSTMILECPNLIAACELFLKNPELATTHGTPEHERTMWVFYGDPGWRDPYMVHRWGYTPKSLAELMRQAGLVNIRQEPAQFKKREPRDMRLVGEKPAHNATNA